MNTVDDLLAQSLLLHQPRVPSDVVGHEDLDYAGLTEALLLRDGEVPDRGDDRAAQSLTALCEAVVARCAPEQLADFLTDQVPQPRAAWILGCALRLAGAHDGARFWWQYAAGADDAPASYCLYLQHLADGDTHAAALWQAQAGVHAPEAEDHEDDGHDTDADGGSPVHRVITADASLSTVLQVLSRLSRVTPRRHTPAAQAVIDFVATEVAIGYDRHPDLEIPLPGEDFAERLVVIAAAFSLSDPRTAEPEPAGALPNRPPQDRAAEHVPAPRRAQGPARLLVKVTADGHQGASAHVFFKEAVAVCWEKATAAGGADARGSRMSYYLNRVRTRATLALSPAAAGYGTGAPFGVGGPVFFRAR
ncbi:hypothetical protein AB0I16_32990 [Streptomyces sp. NPDC050703]|uniref:hypothetical protein n=1 Tax=Streptomyces sp. NPDC050703 TaxID=3157218 RepID=UPI0034368AE6